MNDITCPKCGKKMIFDPNIEEVLCPFCGFVPDDRVVSSRPEWRAIEPEDKIRRCRAGPPVTLTKHDLGLSTNLGFSNVDAHGGPLADQGQVKRMRAWQNRIRVGSASEKSMVALLTKVSELADSLNLPDNVVETASLIIRRAMKMGMTSKRSTAGIAAAAIYIACKQCNVQRSLKEVAKAAEVKVKSLGAYYRLLCAEMKEVKAGPVPLEKYISKISNRLGLPPSVSRLAIAIAREVKDPNIISGKQPSGLAAAFLYIAAGILDEVVFQRDIAAAAGVTEVTIRKRCREVLENYRISIRLR